MDNAPWGNVPQWLSAIGTISAVLVALFKDIFTARRNRPKLKISLNMSPPDIQAVSFNGSPGYYLRFWIFNDGNTKATNAQIYASRLEERNSDGEYVDANKFTPMNFTWSYGNASSGMPEIYAGSILPKMGKHCDFGSITGSPSSVIYPDMEDHSPYRKFSLALEFCSNSGNSMLAPGHYRLHLIVAAENFQPQTQLIEFGFTGGFSTIASRMFPDYLYVQVQ